MERTIGEQLREGPFQHGWAGRGKEARAAHDLISAEGGEDVGRVHIVVLIPLATIRDGDVPFEPPAKDVGAQLMHLLQKILMLDISVGRDCKNLHSYLRLNFVRRDEDHLNPPLAICRSAEGDSLAGGSHEPMKRRRRAISAGPATADLQFPLTIRHQWNLPNWRKHITESARRVGLRQVR